MPRHPLEPSRDSEQLLDALVLLLHLFQRRALGQRLFEIHVERRRHCLGDAVGVRIRDIHHPRDVTHHGARLHGAEGDDLRDVRAAVLARDVLDDLAAAALAEVDVDIRQRHALGIQESFEDQVVGDRIDVGDPQAVRDEAPRRRSSPRADGDALSRAHTG